MSRNNTSETNIDETADKKLFYLFTDTPVPCAFCYNEDITLFAPEQDLTPEEIEADGGPLDEEENMDVYWYTCECCGASSPESESEQHARLSWNILSQGAALIFATIHAEIGGLGNLC